MRHKLQYDFDDHLLETWTQSRCILIYVQVQTSDLGTTGQLASRAS
jgi:hypothetical protein